MKSLLLASTAAAAIGFGAAFAGAQPDQSGGPAQSSMTRQHGPNAGGMQQRGGMEGNPARINAGRSTVTGNNQQPSEFRHPGREENTELQNRHGERNANRPPRNEPGLTGSSQSAQPENTPLPSPSTPPQSMPTPSRRHNAQMHGQRPTETAQPRQPTTERHNRAAETGEHGEFRTQSPTVEPQRFRTQERAGQSAGGAGLHWTERPGVSLSVGAVVPRGERIYSLPPAIARRLPQYRGNRYIAFRDRIAIVQPHTMRVVAVLPAASFGIGVGVGSSIPPRGTALVLSAQQRQRISARIRSVSLRPGFAFTVGATVPGSVQLLPVPPQVVAVAPQLRGFRFVSECGKFAIVDPQTMRIVAVLPG